MFDVIFCDVSARPVWILAIRHIAENLVASLFAVGFDGVFPPEHVSHIILDLLFPLIDKL